MNKNHYQIHAAMFKSYSDIKCAMSKKEIKPHEGDHLKGKKLVKRIA